MQPSWDQRTGGNGHEVTKFVGQSVKMKQVIRMIERVAPSDIPVLICGESGTGKEVVARLLHQNSGRSSNPFLKVNCAAIPRDLLESELFGYERGSFTGAFHSKPGKFELVHKGTIYLDEISEMSPGVQPKLLQVLQDKEFSRLGAREAVVVDVRFISSTNQLPEKLLSEGRFREDLYYRLNVVTLQLPPLRERKEDIPGLARHLLEKNAPAFHREGFELSDNVLEVFTQYDWPGNVRELENVIRKLLAFGDESAVLERTSWNFVEEDPASPARAEDDYGTWSLKEVARIAAREAERELILKALRKTNWNRKRAAQLLKISYKAMLYKLKDAGLAKNAPAPSSA